MFVASSLIGVTVPVFQYIFLINQSQPCVFLINTIQFIFSSNLPIKILDPLIGQHPKENIRPQSGEHPVFPLIDQPKAAFAFLSTNHHQTKTTLAK